MKGNRLPRVTVVRYIPGRVAVPTILRRRGFRVRVVGRWLVMYTPRHHWSHSL